MIINGQSSYDILSAAPHSPLVTSPFLAAIPQFPPIPYLSVNHQSFRPTRDKQQSNRLSSPLWLMNDALLCGRFGFDANLIGWILRFASRLYPATDLITPKTHLCVFLSVRYS